MENWRPTEEERVLGQKSCTMGYSPESMAQTRDSEQTTWLCGRERPERGWESG